MTALPKINRSEIAKRITLAEGKKESKSIAQVLEQNRLYNELLTLEEVVAMWNAYHK